MSQERVYTAAEREARAEVCREVARQLNLATQAFAAVELEGWMRHLQRDAELLDMRALRELGEVLAT